MRKKIFFSALAMIMALLLAACNITVHTPGGDIGIQLPAGTPETPTEPNIPTVPTDDREDPALVERTNILLRNVATGEYLNYDYGTLTNGTYVRVWPGDGSAEQRWDIVHVGDGVYRILTNKSNKYCLDVYRGSADLKYGQVCDIWQNGGDTVAQNVKFYLCDDGTYIIRMAEDPSFVLSATESMGRVKLAVFDANSKAQKWVIKDAPIADDSSSDETTASGIPASAYDKTGECYTVSGIKYYKAVTNREYNGVASGEMFFVDSDGKVVINSTVLNKLYQVEFFNSQQRNQLGGIAAQNARVVEDYYKIYLQVAANEKLGSIVGKSSGILLGIGTGNSYKIADAAMDITSEVCSPETIKAAALVGMLEMYTNNTVSSGRKAAELMATEVTDYDVYRQCAESFSDCVASFAAVNYLAGDTVEEMKQSSLMNELRKYFTNVFIGLADAVIPDIPAVEVTKYIADGVMALSEFAIESGAQSAYDNTYDNWINPLFSAKGEINKHNKLAQASTNPTEPSIPSVPVENAVIPEKTNIFLQNVATGEYLNYDYGTLENGTPVRVWPLDSSIEQRWDIVKVSGTTYRIHTNQSSKYCLDVYRGTATLKAGQECDIWQTGEDAIAQNLVFYACTDGSYIIRMENNPNLALAASGSKGAVKLAKFDASSSAQKWVIKDTSSAGNQTGSSKYVADGLSASLDKVKAKYPEGTNVSHSYVFPNTSAYECHGFACYALMMIWGSSKPGVTNTSEYKTYHATSTQSYVDVIRPGDLVRYRSGNYDHTIVVTNVDADNIYYADCNADLKCTFEYDKVMSKNALASKLIKTLIDQSRSVRGYILHYKNNTL